MRYDQSVRGLKSLLDQGALGEPVLATIDMRAVPHWMPWQQSLGWLTMRIMSIHHLDTFRYWLGDPTRVFASVRPDPRTDRKFAHTDGICLYILEYENGRRASAWDDVWAGPGNEGSAKDNYIRWRVEAPMESRKGLLDGPTILHQRQARLITQAFAPEANGFRRDGMKLGFRTLLLVPWRSCFALSKTNRNRRSAVAIT